MTTSLTTLKKNLFSPLSMFFFHGAPCCPTMNWHKDLNFLLDAPNCYLSPRIEDANVCLVFGSIARPLAQIITNSTLRMPEKRAMVHFLGCFHAPPNYLILEKPCLTFNICEIDENVRIKCLEGINACLKA